MARTVKTASARKNEILDAAQKLFGEVGYAHSSVQAIIDAVGIAKGTFYHHFRSKSDLLDALVMRLVDQMLPLVQPLLDDPDMAAIDKFLGFFQRIGAWKVAQRSLLVEVNTALQEEANLRLMVRLREASMEVSVPLLSQIIAQGVQEAVFHTRHPDETARIVMKILESLSTSLAELMPTLVGNPAAREALEAINEAHEEAIERVLGAPSGSLCIIDRKAIGLWLEAMGKQTPDDPATAPRHKHRRSS